jgi:hypothetical protein
VVNRVTYHVQPMFIRWVNEDICVYAVRLTACEIFRSRKHTQAKDQMKICIGERTRPTGSTHPVAL